MKDDVAYSDWRMVITVGSPLKEKAGKHNRLCQEKATRLLAHPLHLCAAESADPEQEKYSGAIRIGGYILAYSGFPGDADEFFLLRLLYPEWWERKNIGFIPTWIELNQIAWAGKNQLWGA